MDDARELRQRGIQAAKAGQKDEARELLQQSIRLDASNEAAWLWLASVAHNNRERLFCLQQLLDINPENESARKALEAANQAAPAPTVQRLPNAPVTKLATSENVASVASQSPGVPVPMPDRIAEAQKQADALVRGYLAPPDTNIKWVHKTHRRAGERDILVYRMYVLGGVLAFIVVLIVIGFILVQTNDDVREVVLGPSATPTPSPTITPTNTPGITPTPSATPRLTPTPSATPPPNLLAASPPALPRATEIYPEILERSVYEAVLLLNQGDIAEAVPTLEKERQLSFDTRLDPNPYYYAALAMIEQGRYDDAIDTLDEAAGRVEERPDNLKIKPFLDSGYAQVYWAQAQQATTAGDPAKAQEALTQMSDHALAAIDGDDRLVEPYLLLAQANAQQGGFSDALDVLDKGLAVSELTSNTELLMQKAQVYFLERDYEQALYQIFLALYIDPTVEAAYQLKIQIAMLRNRPGDAVLAAQDYLFYYPGSTTAYRLLGDARVAEHKDDLALAAYSQGLAGDGTDADAQRMMERRAQIYHRQRRYDEAAADYSHLFQLTDEDRFRGLRMQEAFAAGQYDEAAADAEALDGSGIVEQGMLHLIRGAALVEQAQPEDRATHQQALQFLSQASVEVTTNDLRGSIYEYMARTQLALDDTESALTAIQLALGIDETGSRHYWRGRIYEAQNDKAEAILDYEWVLGWSEIFPYPFRVDAEDRLNELRA